MPRKSAFAAVLILFLATRGHASDRCVTIVPDPLSSIFKISSFSEMNICADQVKIKIDEIAANEYASLFPGTDAVEIREIQGVRLTGTHEQLEIAEKVVSPRPPARWKNVVGLCAGDDVVCALSRLADPKVKSFELGQHILVTAKKFGYMISFDQNPGVQSNCVAGDEPKWVADTWKPDDVRWLHNMLDRLPEEFSHVPAMSHFYKEGRMPESKATQCDILAWTQPPYQGRPGYFALRTDPVDRAGSFIHEMAHEISFANTTHGKYQLRGSGAGRLSTDPEWMALSGWKREIVDGKETFAHDPAAQFVSPYAGALSPEEDLAETVSHLINNPSHAFLAAPSKVSWVASHLFSGATFFDRNLDPQVKRALKKWGGPGRLVQGCFAQMKDWRTEADHYDKSKMQLTTAYGGTITPELREVLFDRLHVTDDNLVSLCSHDLAKSIFGDWKESDFCMAGGRKKVESDLATHLLVFMNRITQSMEDSTFKPSLACKNQSLAFQMQCSLSGDFEKNFKSDLVLQQLGDANYAQKLIKDITSHWKK